MADSSIRVPAGTEVDTRTQVGGDHRQVVVVGDATDTYTQTVGATGAALVALGGAGAIAGEQLVQENNSALILRELRRISHALALLTGERIFDDDLEE